jgi:hypothetical protein
MEELTGHLVMVHPDLTNDPVDRQGQIGIITSASLEKDEIYVGFGTDKLGLYSTDALLVLKPHRELYSALLTHARDLETPDFKTLMEASLLQQKGGVSDLRDAMGLALSNERVLAFSTVSLQQALGLSRQESHTQQQSAQTGR